MTTRLTVDRLHELRAQHLELALRDIVARHDTPTGDGITVSIARRALGEQAS
jgi:hypothetical protein